ncbi:hypothetical protein [Bacillus testis]|uniref:hypothetical protein n=1 Tax=Bacillus testis TaxID=1622072 RepID=UPI00067E7D6E|nr:hypothetical protein [Bacillus testis]
MKDYKTENIMIMNCSLDLAKSIVLFRKELTDRSPITIPGQWPSYRFRSFLPFLIEDMEKEQDSPFHLWILADLINKMMVGDFLMYPSMRQKGVAYLEVHYLSFKEERLYFKESLRLFLEYVMPQFKGRYDQVALEVQYTDHFKMELLKKFGFTLKKNDHPYLLWSYKVIKKEDK